MKTERGQGSDEACRRCRSDLTGAPIVNLYENLSFVPESVTLWGCKCPACGWPNQSGGSQSHSVDLRACLEATPELAASVQDTRGASAVTNALLALRSSIVARIRTEVLDAPAVAVLWLLNALVYRDRGSFRATERFTLAAQQVYAILLSREPLPAFPDFGGLQLPDAWLGPIPDLLLTTVVLSGFIRDVGLGLAAAEIADGVVSYTLSEDAMWSFEMNLATIAGPPVTETEPASLRDVERIAFGYSVGDFCTLMTVPDALKEYTRVTQNGDLTILDLGPSTHPVVTSIAGHFLLTRERLQRQEVPSFFFADPRRVWRSEQAMAVQATEADWFRYAPLLSATYMHEGQLVPAAITSRELVQWARARALGSVAARLHHATIAAKDRGGAAYAQVKTLARAVHSDFEASAAARLIGLGMEAVHNLERVDGRTLPCGEIDVLAVGPTQTGHLLALICEAKNTDVTVYKDLGISQARALMDHAALQATRKAAWVRSHWSKVAQLFTHGEGAPLVVALIVTRHSPLPLGAGMPAVVPLHELAPTVTAMCTLPVEAWRPDLRESVTYS